MYVYKKNSKNANAVLENVGGGGGGDGGGGEGGGY